MYLIHVYLIIVINNYLHLLSLYNYNCCFDILLCIDRRRPSKPAKKMFFFFLLNSVIFRTQLHLNLGLVDLFVYYYYVHAHNTCGNMEQINDKFRNIVFVTDIIPNQNSNELYII